MKRIINLMKIVTLFGVIVSSTFLLMSFDFSETWKAPISSKNISNPLANNSDATVEGKKLYTNMCVVCHGNKGKGDGIAGMALKPKPSNLTQALVQEQSDGEIFWKITEGRAPMASYKELLAEEQRWQLVNYIRTLKK
jgi:mono/diheme cytochrome c family protein